MNKEVSRKIIERLFVIYCIVLFFILFLYGARRGNQFQLAVFSKEHIDMINIIPFKTIGNFVERMHNSTINTSIVVQNILANSLMFVPMGMALPVLFEEKFNKIWKFLLFIIILVLLVEIIQFLTFCGSADIDDLILNTLSGVIGYGIIKIKPIRNLLKIEQ